MPAAWALRDDHQSPVAFTAKAIFQAAAQLLNDQRGRPRLQNRIRDDQQRLAGLNHGFHRGNHCCSETGLLVAGRMITSSSSDCHSSVVVKVRRQVKPRVELHAFDESVSVSRAFVLFDGDDTSLPTLHRSQRSDDRFQLRLGRDVPTCATSSLSLTGRAAALHRFDDFYRLPGRCRVQVQSVSCQRRRTFMPSRRWPGQNRCGVVCRHRLHRWCGSDSTICAPMFSNLFFQFDTWRHYTVLRDARCAEDCPEQRCPFGPE